MHFCYLIPDYEIKIILIFTSSYQTENEYFSCIGIKIKHRMFRHHLMAVDSTTVIGFYTVNSGSLAELSHSMIDWLVGCFEDFHRFSSIQPYHDLKAGDNQSLKS